MYQSSPYDDNFLYSIDFETFKTSIVNKYFNSIDKKSNVSISESYNDNTILLDNDFNSNILNQISETNINDNFQKKYENLSLSDNNWIIDFWFNYNDYDNSNNREFILIDNYFDKNIYQIQE